MAGIVTLFESTDAGAPVLNNAVGSLIAVLDACLITGYNTKSVTSITVASGVATVVCTAHGFSNIYGKVIRISGATPAGLNIDTRISNVTTDGYTFLCPGVADGAATGTLVAKYAPMNWTKQFTGSNLAMYKRSNAAANGCMLRVDDTGATARTLMVQTASAISTYTNESPTTVQIAGGQYWPRNTVATAADWFVVADDLFFYLFTATVSGTQLAHYPCYFGDAPSFRQGDTLNCLLGGAVQAAMTDDPIQGGITTSGAAVISGGLNGSSISQTICMDAKSTSIGGAGYTVYPSLVDGGLVIKYPLMFVEGATVANARGNMPGLAEPYANVVTAFTQKLQVSIITGTPKTFLVCKLRDAYGADASSQSVLIDLTGPWR